MRLNFLFAVKLHHNAKERGKKIIKKKVGKKKENVSEIFQRQRYVNSVK